MILARSASFALNGFLIRGIIIDEFNNDWEDPCTDVGFIPYIEPHLLPIELYGAPVNSRFRTNSLSGNVCIDNNPESRC